jgi:hypothetical protein
VKRGPKQGEPYLIHVTKNTGDRQEFAICPENFDPEALDALEVCWPVVPAFDWRIELDEGNRFTVLVWPDKRRMLTAASDNRVELMIGHGQKGEAKPSKYLLLETTLLSGAKRLSPEKLGALADLEQCAAIVRFIKWRHKAWGLRG